MSLHMRKVGLAWPALVGVDGHPYPGAGAGQHLVNRVVHDLVDEVMKGFVIGAAHVHTRAPANGLQPFQYLNIFCLVARELIVGQVLYLEAHSTTTVNLHRDRPRLAHRRLP